MRQGAFCFRDSFDFADADPKMTPRDEEDEKGGDKGDEDKDAAVPLAQDRPTSHVEPATVAQPQATRSAMDRARRPAVATELG